VGAFRLAAFGETTDPHDGQSRLEFAWDDVHLNVIRPTTRTRFPMWTEDSSARWVFRQPHSQPRRSWSWTTTPSWWWAEPGGPGSLSPGDLSAFAGIPPPGEGTRSSCHRGHLALGAVPGGGRAKSPSTNVQGLRYADDNERCDLAAIPKTIEVFPAGAVTHPADTNRRGAWTSANISGIAPVARAQTGTTPRLVHVPPGHDARHHEGRLPRTDQRVRDHRRWRRWTRTPTRPMSSTTCSTARA